MIVLAPNSIFVFLLALGAAAGMWRLYRKGHPHLRPPFVWLLPLLRATAVFMVVVTLAEPALQRNVEQQLLSRLRFVVDESASMLATDADMPVDQKVEIAIAHGWLNASEVNLDDIKKVAMLRETLQDSTRSNASLDQAQAAVAQLAEAELGEMSLQAKSLLREDWVPSVAHRRQIQVNVFAKQLAELESERRAKFRESFEQNIPQFDESNRLDRVRDLLKRIELLKSEHEVTIEQLGQVGVLTDLTAIAPPGSNSGQSETIVLLSDGQHHADSISPSDAAALWASSGSQLFTVGFGSIEPRTDLILVDTRQKMRLAPSDLISGALEVYDSMPSGQPLKLEITDDDTSEILWSDEVETSGEGSRVFSFAFRISSNADELPSLLKLSAQILKVDGEARDDNNSMPMPVFLSPPPQSSMLVIDGRPRWDTRYLRNIFRRDPTWKTDVNFAPNEEALPDQSTLKSYDLIVLGELPSEVVSDQHLKWLEEHVRGGGGLVLIDGPREELRGLLNDHALSPVTWFDAPQWLDQPHLELTKDGSLEPALTLAPNKADNEAIWSYLPSPHRATRARPKSGATILAEARSETGNTPLLITQMLGDGRVLYISSDESWRWRYQKGDEYHTRYWQQLARWVMADPYLIKTEEAEFDLDRLRIREGETASVRARVAGNDADGNEVAGLVRVQTDDPNADNLNSQASSYEAIVTRDGEEVLRTTDVIEGLTPGIYEVSLAGVDNTTIPLTVIEPTSIEETVTHANPRLLNVMAERGNGEYFDEHEFQQLLSILKSKRAIVTKMDTTSIWQSYGWLLVIVMLVASELFLRKRAGLL